MPKRVICRIRLCGTRDRLLVAAGVGPAHVDGLAARVAHLLDDGHQVGQDLEGMVDVALHVEHGHAAGLGHLVDVLVAEVPVALADGDAVVVAAIDLADLLGGVAVADLGRVRVDEGGVAAQLGHARLEAGAGAGAGEEEEQGQRLVAQQRWGMPSARSRLSLSATSITVSISSLLKSMSLMKSRPRRSVCILISPLHVQNVLE